MLWIFPFGIGIDFISVGSMVNVPSTYSVFTLKSFKISINAATSWMSGTPSNTTGSSAIIAAGIKATVLFFAPLMVTSPFNGLPPLMTNFLILKFLSLNLLSYYTMFI